MTKFSSGRRDFDLGVCERQAVGGRFVAGPRDELLVGRILEGELKLAPHPAWALPDELTWREDPFAQRNWVFQLHCLSWIDPLRRSYLTGQMEYGKAARRRWNELAVSWMRANPRDDKAASWNDMATGLRTIEFVLGYPLVFDEHRDEFIAGLEDHMKFLADPQTRGGANHAMHHVMGFFVLSRFFKDQKREAEAIDALGELLSSEFDQEGTNEEGAVKYHVLNYQWWNQNLERLALEGLELPNARAVLENTVANLPHAIRPDGTWELIGDSQRGSLRQIQTAEAQWVSTDGKAGKPPEGLVKVLKSGYVYGRSGWGGSSRSFSDETFYSARFGRGGRNHSHRDAASLTVYSHRHALLVDPGNHSYNHKNPLRQFVVSRAAHNVLHVPDRDYDRSATAELLWSKEDDNVHDFCIRDRGYEGVRIERRVVYSRDGDFFVVVDRAWSDGPVRVQQLWHLNPKARVARRGGGAVISCSEVDSTMEWLESVGEFQLVKGQRMPPQGWYCEGWMEETPAPVMVVSKEARNSARFVTVLAPGVGGRAVLDWARTKSAYEVSIRVPNGRHFLRVPLDHPCGGCEGPSVGDELVL